VRARRGALHVTIKGEWIFVVQLGERRRESGMYIFIHEHFEPAFNNAGGKKTPPLD